MDDESDVALCSRLQVLRGGLCRFPGVPRCAKRRDVRPIGWADICLGLLIHKEHRRLPLEPGDDHRPCPSRGGLPAGGTAGPPRSCRSPSNRSRGRPLVVPIPGFPRRALVSRTPGRGARTLCRRLPRPDRSGRSGPLRKAFQSGETRTRTGDTKNSSRATGVSGRSSQFHLSARMPHTHTQSGNFGFAYVSRCLPPSLAAFVLGRCGRKPRAHPAPPEWLIPPRTPKPRRVPAA